MVATMFLKQDNGNIGKMSTKYGNLNPFSSRYLKSDNTIFEASSSFSTNLL
jgi:zinc finger CCCH domain-containing protein 13